MRIPQAIVMVVAASGANTAAASPPLVPPDWHQVQAPGGTARIFVSPDGSARIRFGHEPTRSISAERLMNKPGERVTYRTRGASWFAVSGYRGNEIFYRKGNLACGGSRWNLVEFRYPREAKRQMDATVKMVAHNMGAYGRDCG